MACQGPGLTHIHSDSQLAAPLTTLYAAVRRARLEADLSVDMKLRLGTPYEVVCHFLIGCPGAAVAIGV